MYSVCFPDKGCYFCVQLSSILLVIKGWHHGSIDTTQYFSGSRACWCELHFMTSVNDFDLPTSNIYLCAWTSENTAERQREWHYFLTSSLSFLLILLPCTHVWEVPDSCVRMRIYTYIYMYILFCHFGPTRTMASLFTRFPVHTQRLIAVSRTPLVEL